MLLIADPLIRVRFSFSIEEVGLNIHCPVENPEQCTRVIFNTIDDKESHYWDDAQALSAIDARGAEMRE